MLKLGNWWFVPANVIEILKTKTANNENIFLIQYMRGDGSMTEKRITGLDFDKLDFFLETFGPAMGYKDLNKIYDDRENILKMMEAAKTSGPKN